MSGYLEAFYCTAPFICIIGEKCLQYYLCITVCIYRTGTNCMLGRLSAKAPSSMK